MQIALINIKQTYYDDKQLILLTRNHCFYEKLLSVFNVFIQWFLFSRNNGINEIYFMYNIVLYCTICLHKLLLKVVI